MQQRGRQTCARNLHNADTLTAIADEIRAARDLVKVGHLASLAIDGEEADAIAELLDTIGKRFAVHRRKDGLRQQSRRSIRVSALARIPRRRPAPTPILGHLTPVLRQRIGDAIEILLALLDAADGDTDLKDGADTEPNCGSSDTYGFNDECEPEDEGDELDAGEHDDAEISERSGRGHQLAPAGSLASNTVMSVQSFKPPE